LVSELARLRLVYFGICSRAAIEGPQALAYLIGRSTGVPMSEVLEAMATASSAPEHGELARLSGVGSSD
jgi:hypothetical protein